MVLLAKVCSSFKTTLLLCYDFTQKMKYFSENEKFKTDSEQNL